MSREDGEMLEQAETLRNLEKMLVRGCIITLGTTKTLRLRMAVTTARSTEVYEARTLVELVQKAFVPKERG
jgi:hypothetical protein